MARKSRYDSLADDMVKNNVAYKAGIYCRLSVADGDNEDGNSIINQKKIAETFINSSDVKFIEWYYDNGYSGKNFNRPGFMRMMDDVDKGKINCIIVKDISRFGRDFVVTSDYVKRILPEKGVRLVCVTDSYDSLYNSDVSPLDSLTIKMLMNDTYVYDASKKINSSIAAKMECGEFLASAGSIPYGYIRNPERHTFDIGQGGAYVVKRIFYMGANGMKISAIGRILNEEGVPSPGKLRFIRGVTKAKKYENSYWIRGTIRKILNDQVYIGNRVHGKTKKDNVGKKKQKVSEDKWIIIENSHPAIISSDLFNKVAEVNKKERELLDSFDRRAPIKYDCRDLLRNKLVCGDCNSTMSGLKAVSRKNSKNYSKVYYECNQFRYSNRIICCSHYINGMDVLATLIDLINNQFKIAIDVQEMKKVLQNHPRVKTQKNNSKELYKSLCLKINSLETKKGHLLNDLIEGIIGKTEYETIKKRYDFEISRLEVAKEQVSVDMSAFDDAFMSSKEWLELIKTEVTLDSIDRKLVDVLVKRIVIYSDKRIKIELNYSNPYESMNHYLDKIGVMEDAG